MPPRSQGFLGRRLSERRMVEGRAATASLLLEAVRALRVADPDLGVKPLIAKLREQQPEWGTKKVRVALKALKALEKESEAKAAATSPPTYLCGDDCPADPEAWELHGAFHKVEAATKRFLEATERYPVESVGWAEATARAFNKLTLSECAKVANKPEWWNDEGLKALSARVVKALPNDDGAHDMRGLVLSGQSGAWEVGSRSAAELTEAATCFERSAALTHVPAVKAQTVGHADWCRSEAEALCNHTRNVMRRYM